LIERVDAASAPDGSSRIIRKPCLTRLDRKETTTMKLKTRLMLFTAAMTFSASMALAAIDPQALADSYTADGYTYVEIKQGPTQTKLEAIKGDVVVEVIYSNETGEIISQESQAVDPEDASKTGVEIKVVSADSEDAPDANDDEHHSGSGHDGDDDSEDDDHSGSGHDGDGEDDSSDDDHDGDSGGSDDDGDSSDD
jgi:hypothetical protein